MEHLLLPFGEQASQRCVVGLSADGMGGTVSMSVLPDITLRPDHVLPSTMDVVDLN